MRKKKARPRSLAHVTEYISVDGHRYQSTLPSKITSICCDGRNGDERYNPERYTQVVKERYWRAYEIAREIAPTWADGQAPEPAWER